MEIIYIRTEEDMTCNDFYSAPRMPYNEFIQGMIYRNILFKGNELVRAYISV